MLHSDSVSNAGSTGSKDGGEGIRHWLGVPRGGSRNGGSAYSGSTISGHGGRESVADTMSTYSYR